MFISEPNIISAKKPAEENYETLQEKDIPEGRRQRSKSNFSCKSLNAKGKNKLSQVEDEKYELKDDSGKFNERDSKPNNIILTKSKNCENDILLSIPANEYDHIGSKLLSNHEKLGSNDIASPLNVKFSFPEHLDRVENLDDIKFREINNYFSSLYFSRDKELTEVDQHNNNNDICCSCIVRFFRKYSKKYNLNEDLLNEKNLIFFMYYTPYDSKDKMHEKMMRKIFYNFATEDEKKNEVKTEDLEKFIEIETNSKEILNVYSLVCLIELIDVYPSYLQKRYENFYNNKGGNLLFYLLISISKLCIELLKTDVLNIYFNKNKSVINTMKGFFFGSLEICDSDIEKTKLSNNFVDFESIDFIIVNLRKAIVETSSVPLWKYNSFKDKYPEVKDSISDSFSNNLSN